MQWVSGKFSFRAGEPSGIASSQDQRRWARESETAWSVARAFVRFEMTACGRLRVSAHISLTMGVRAAFKRVAVGLTSEAAAKCSAGVDGVPVMRDGRARPVGWTCVAPVEAVAVTDRFRDGIKFSIWVGAEGVSSGDFPALSSRGLGFLSRHSLIQIHQCGRGVPTYKEM